MIVETDLRFVERNPPRRGASGSIYGCRKFFFVITFGDTYIIYDIIAFIVAHSNTDAILSRSAAGVKGMPGQKFQPG